MPVLITPTTELEAVNECLSNIGQAPTNSISGDLGVDAQMALDFVRSISRELQSEGWFWNTDTEYEVSPADDGIITLPANTLSVDSDGDNYADNVVQRGRLLYSRDNNSYTFTDAISLSLVRGLSFDELPETARRYITMRAARFFQDRIEGVASATDSQDELDALGRLRREQMLSEDNNILSASIGTLNRNIFF